MKAISEKMLHKFWRKLDGWLFDLESLDDRQAHEDHLASGVFSVLVAASHEVNSEGDFIDRFNDLPLIGSLSQPYVEHAQDGGYERVLSAKGEAAFLWRYFTSFRPLWWHWVFYPIRSTRVARVSKVDVPIPHRVWLAEATEADLRVLEFGALTPSTAVAGELRLAIDALGAPSEQLSKACRSMALKSMKNGLKRRRPNPLLTMLCRLGRDACVGAAVLCAVEAFHAVNGDALSSTLTLIGLTGLAVPLFVAGCLLHELGPKWTEADKLMTRLSSDH